MSSNYTISTDLKEAEAMAEGLSDYVRGDQLYGTGIGGSFSNMPNLTVGALLMRLHRLNELRDSMNDAQGKQLDKIIDTWHTTREEWRTHYEQKMVQEIESRIDSMDAFFHECDSNPQNCLNNYRPEIQKRTIIQELLHEMNELNVSAKDVQSKLFKADSQLHRYMQADNFQWSEQLQSVYPKSDYWWLYQKPSDVVTEK